MCVYMYMYVFVSMCVCVCVELATRPGIAWHAGHHHRIGQRSSMHCIIFEREHMLLLEVLPLRSCPHVSYNILVFISQLGYHNI